MDLAWVHIDTMFCPYQGQVCWCALANGFEFPRFHRPSEGPQLLIPKALWMFPHSWQASRLTFRILPPSILVAGHGIF